MRSAPQRGVKEMRTESKTVPPRTLVTRRGFLRSVAATGVSAGLVACGEGDSGREPAGEDQPGTDRQTVLNLWYAFITDDERDWYRSNIVDAFNAAHPESPVELSVRPVDTLDQLQRTALNAGEGPDIILASGPAQAAAYVANGLVQPLDSHASALGWEDTFLPWALDVGRIDGVLYSVAVNYESRVLLYIPAVFDELGWPVATTREEFEGVCAEAASAGMMPIAAGNAEWQAATEWHLTNVFNAHAGPEAVYAALSGDIPWTDPLIRESVALLQSWFEQDWMGGGANRYFTNAFGDLYSRLASGEAALCITGSWAFTEVPAFFGAEAGNSAEWAWAPLPSLRPDVQPGVFPLGIGSTLSLNSDIPDAEAGAAFLDFALGQTEVMANGLAEVGYQPSPIHLDAGDFP